MYFVSGLVRVCVSEYAIRSMITYFVYMISIKR